MEKRYLCTCWACQQILIDENHSYASTLYVIDNASEPIQSLEMIEDGSEYFWGCPRCKDDSNLIDNIADVDAAKINVTKVN